LKKNAIITGYSSGIGKAIVSELEDCYNIIRLETRLENVKDLEKEIKMILKQNDIDLLVNCAGVGLFEPHEELNIAQISKLIDINLQAPIVLVNLLLRSLKKTKGKIINISSIEATKNSKFSALYSATKSGLRSFSLSLFEELRKSGVGVTSINPDITKTEFFNDLKFKNSTNPNTYLDPVDIAKVVKNIVEFNGVVSDITLQPQMFQIERKK